MQEHEKFDDLRTKMGNFRFLLEKVCSDYGNAYDNLTCLDEIPKCRQMIGDCAATLKSELSILDNCLLLMDELKSPNR